MEITFTISDEEIRVVEAHLGKGKLRGWIQHAIDHKINQCADRLILEFTDRQPKKLEASKKMQLLKDVPQGKLDEFYERKHPASPQPGPKKKAS